MCGVELLREWGIRFNAIAVMTRDTLGRAPQLYEFFLKLGCDCLGINIEEREGINLREICDDSSVTQFWRELFQAWKTDPRIRIRELDNVLSWMNYLCSNTNHKIIENRIDILPTVGWNGDVVLLSPEFLGLSSSDYSDFIVGNIRETPLTQILSQVFNLSYVTDFLDGVARCKQECPYFSFCGGGQASNKFVELGSTNATSTSFCRNSKQRLVDAVLEAL